jgi:hypothetical protein
MQKLRDTTAKQAAQQMSPRPPQAILPIHSSYTPKEIKLLKTQALACTKDTDFLIIPLLYQNNKLNPY